MCYDRRQRFLADLRVLKSDGDINVLLRMDWMTSIRV